MTDDRTRRELTMLAAAGSVSGLFGLALPAIAQPVAANAMPMRTAMLVHSGMVLRDLSPARRPA